jgi:hypothetical protein
MRFPGQTADSLTVAKLGSQTLFTPTERIPEFGFHVNKSTGANLCEDRFAAQADSSLYAMKSVLKPVRIAVIADDHRINFCASAHPLHILLDNVIDQVLSCLKL